MTKLSKYQLTHLSHNTQFVLFSIEGKLLESCDSLFPTSALSDQVVFEWFPFLEGIADVLQTMEPGQEMLFERVQKPSASLSGAYNFKIVRPHTETDALLLIIMDYTEMYRQYQALQQQFNELYIEKQRMETELIALENGTVPAR